MRCPSCRLENPPSATHCDCGYGFGGAARISPSGAGEPRSIDRPAIAKGVIRFVWVLPALGSVVGGAEFVLSWSAATGAPQQAVIAAMALAWAILPYCFARAVVGVIKGN
jgi:hypothetical protein